MDYNHLNNKYNCIKIAVLSASNGEPSKIENKNMHVQENASHIYRRNQKYNRKTQMK